MNKRMIELVNKANEQVGYTFKLEDAKQLHELMDKFAELIVRECAGIAKMKVFGLSTFEDAEFVDESIKKHFGVER